MKTGLRRTAWICMTSLLCAFTFVTGTANAQTSAGFSVHAVIPDNQIDVTQTYFDLRMQPGSEQTVEVVITNRRDEPLAAEIRLNAASTGRNGTIVYTASGVRDDIMEVSITDLAAIETEQITVPAHGSKSVAIDIKMPDTPLDGVILGGISVSGGEGENRAQASGGVSLTNKISYVIALKLSENDTDMAADFDLLSISPELVNFRTAVVAKLRNKAARIVKDMEIEAQVFRRGSDTVLYELVNGNAEMAPQSSGDFVIDMKNRPFTSGTYRLKMTAKYDGRTWVWDEEFTIGTEAGGLNSGAVGLIRNYTWLYVLVGALVLTLLWFTAYRSGKHRRPKEDSPA